MIAVIYFRTLVGMLIATLAGMVQAETSGPVFIPSKIKNETAFSQAVVHKQGSIGFVDEKGTLSQLKIQAYAYDDRDRIVKFKTPEKGLTLMQPTQYRGKIYMQNFGTQPGLLYVYPHVVDGDGRVYVEFRQDSGAKALTSAAWIPRASFSKQMLPETELSLPHPQNTCPCDGPAQTTKHSQSDPKAHP